MAVLSLWTNLGSLGRWEWRATNSPLHLTALNASIHNLLFSPLLLPQHWIPLIVTWVSGICEGGMKKRERKAWHECFAPSTTPYMSPKLRLFKITFGYAKCQHEPVMEIPRFTPAEGAKWTTAKLYEIIEYNTTFKNVILSLPAAVVLTASQSLTWLRKKSALNLATRINLLQANLQHKMGLLCVNPISVNVQSRTFNTMLLCLPFVSFPILPPSPLPLGRPNAQVTLLLKSINQSINVYLLCPIQWFFTAVPYLFD